MSVNPEPCPQQNHLLATLSPDVQTRLFPYLELVELPLRVVLYESGRTMSHVYFSNGRHNHARIYDGKRIDHGNSDGWQ